MENLLFTGIHTVFLRLHNQIAKAFGEKYSYWSSNEIYEETRALNIAIFQHFTYKLFLPILLGDKLFAAEFGDGPTVYDPTVRIDELKQITNELFVLAGSTRCQY